MALRKMPRIDNFLTIVKESGKADPVFQRFWDEVAKALEANFGSIEEALEAAGIAIAAAEQAELAAENAQTAANNAQSAAEDAQNVGDGASSVANLTNSGAVGITVTGIDFGGTQARILISAHTRVYGDGSSVPVNSGVITSLLYDTEYWVYYDDPSRSGGAVTYIATTVESDAAQVNNRHLVGKVRTPNIGSPDENGQFKPAPGLGELRDTTV